MPSPAMHQCENELVQEWEDLTDSESNASMPGEVTPLSINVPHLLDNYWGLRRAIAGFLSSDAASSIFEIHRYLRALDDICSPKDTVENNVNVEQPANMTADDLKDTAEAVRCKVLELGLRGGPLPLRDRHRSLFRPAEDVEILGVDIPAVRQAIFEDDCAVGALSDVMSQGWLKNVPAAPSNKGTVFYVVIRGTQVGIFNSADDAEHCFQRVPHAERKGCKNYFQAFDALVQGWLRGDVGIHIPPGRVYN